MIKCINISAREAKDLKDLPPNWACISINEEHDGYHHLQFDDEEDRLLRVRFSDITYVINQLGKSFSPISRETAREIVSFAEKHKDKNFIIHCAAGVSRSAAVCLFLNLVYGHKLKENYFHVSEPNPFVLGMLLIEYKKSL